MKLQTHSKYGALLVFLACNKPADELKDVVFYGKERTEVRSRLQGTWQNHYSRHADGGIVSFPDCFMDFRLTAQDSLIITCGGTVTSRAAMTWDEKVIPESAGAPTAVFTAHPINSGNEWPVAPEQIRGDTLMLLELGASRTRYVLSRR